MSNAVHYSELGLVNTRDMFAKAMAGGYAIPAYNFNNLEQLQAIIQACVETESPVILQVSSGARKYANQTILLCPHIFKKEREYQKRNKGQIKMPNIVVENISPNQNTH